MNFWRKEGKVILVGGGFLGLVVVGLAFLAASFLADLATKIPPTARPALHPARLGLFCEDVELTAKDGKRISGWWMPRGQKGNPPVVVLHGLGAGKAHMIDYILFAQAAGYPVLAIDFRGHGMSEASLTSIGYYESWDVEAAMEFVRKRGAGDPVLWGTSMGGGGAFGGGGGWFGGGGDCGCSIRHLSQHDSASCEVNVRNVGISPTDTGDADDRGAGKV